MTYAVSIQCSRGAPPSTRRALRSSSKIVKYRLTKPLYYTAAELKLYSILPHRLAQDELCRFLAQIAEGGTRTEHSDELAGEGQELPHQAHRHLVKFFFPSIFIFCAGEGQELPHLHLVRLQCGIEV